MVAETNTQDPREMDTELFKLLDKGLREIFIKNVNSGVFDQRGMTAAHAAQALLTLHRDFTPKR